MKLLTACFTGLLLTAVVAHADPAKTVRLAADLDHDGLVDSVTVTFPQSDYGYDRYRVEVRGATYDGIGENLDGDAIVTDIDTADSSLEIMIPEMGPSDDYATSFHRYHDGKIQFMGRIPGTGLIPDGSGVIRTVCRGSILCTWFYKCACRWDDEAQVLVEVPQPFKHMDVKVRLRRDLALTRTPVFYFKDVILKAGTPITIDLTDDRRWCRVRTATGVAGWFAVEGERLTPGGEPTLDTFDELPMAD